MWQHKHDRIYKKHFAEKILKKKSHQLQKLSEKIQTTVLNFKNICENLFHGILTTLAEVMVHTHYIAKRIRTTATKQEIGLTAAMDGFDLSRGPGCVTSAPKIITGSWNILDGLNVNYRLYIIWVSNNFI